MELRPLTIADAAAMLDLRLRNREHFLTGEPAHGASFFSLDAQEAALAQVEDLRRVGTRETFAIVDEGELAGWIALSQIFRGSFQNAFLGYAVGRERSGRGLATAAVQATVAHAFAIGLHRVQANVVPSNAASLRVLAKNGFRREGLALRYLRVGHDWADHLMFAKTVEDERG